MFCANFHRISSHQLQNLWFTIYIAMCILVVSDAMMFFLKKESRKTFQVASKNSKLMVESGLKLWNIYATVNLSRKMALRQKMSSQRHKAHGSKCKDVLKLRAASFEHPTANFAELQVKATVALLQRHELGKELRARPTTLCEIHVGSHACIRCAS